MAKNLSLKIMPDDIIGHEIMKHGDFNAASIAVKAGKDTFLRVSYEWQGSTVPELVMQLMDFIRSNSEEIAKLEEEHAEEYAALKERV